MKESWKRTSTHCETRRSMGSYGRMPWPCLIQHGQSCMKRIRRWRGYRSIPSSGRVVARKTGHLEVWFGDRFSSACTNGIYINRIVRWKENPPSNFHSLTDRRGKDDELSAGCLCANAGIEKRRWGHHPNLGQRCWKESETSIVYEEQLRTKKKKP